MFKNGRLGIFGVKCQNSAKPYNMVLIRKLLGPRKRKKTIKKTLRLKVDVWAYSVINFKNPLTHTIWGSFESSWAPENGKIIKTKTALERPNGAQSKIVQKLTS